MAQKTEKEETEFKAPEALTSCVNNCGVTGNPATNNMCQKCFTATTATATTSSSSAASSLATILNGSSPASSATTTTATTSKSRVSVDTSPRSSFSRSPARDLPPETSPDADTPSDQEKLALARKAVNRCSGCRRKVGLTGFRCRCGELFCSEHRYSDRHDCSYDYKTAGREAIARENPVVKAAKIVRV
ncbi:unnamed protein product [Linum tenue]|uniref:Zinc finger A20 and AN1 domain-containing stress-associated protein 5 n=2 Tax=Linum TaxID=4005 RepID=A0AAV0L1G7_9ROSI|nr:unnamed protein product [Linum tenue]